MNKQKSKVFCVCTHFVVTLAFWECGVFLVQSSLEACNSVFFFLEVGGDDGVPPARRARCI